SFFDGGRHNDLDHALRKAEQLLSDGVDIIDIGAYSSRPGAAVVSPDEEINRALPVIQELVKRYPDLILSIDTFRANVAEACVQSGVILLIDISGGSHVDDMFASVERLQVTDILTHMRTIH